MNTLINIVEPTLNSEAGHCLSLIKNLVKNTHKQINFVVWAGIKTDLKSTPSYMIKNYFFRNIRQIQKYFLYRKLLKLGEKVLVSTAGTMDLFILNFASFKVIPTKRIYLYFHWINSSPKKLEQLKRIAKKQPNLMILGTTKSVVNVFKQAGFSNVELAPYPVTIQENKKTEKQSFRNVLFAGAARQDKGFSHTVDLIESVKSLNLKIPFLIQSSPDHHNKYDEKTKSDIARLKRIKYKHLKINESTLNEIEYLKMFKGAICLQAYDTVAFKDRVSGVTLDALSAGCPIITTQGTWIANIVEEFGAGIIVNSTSPDEMRLAIDKIIADYTNFSDKAVNAGESLQENHKNSHFISILTN